MEYARFAMGKAEPVFLVGVEWPLGGWRGRRYWVDGRDLLVLCESRVSAWLWRCAMLPAEVCHAADRPSKVLCLSSEVRHVTDRAAEMRRLSGRPVEIAPSR